MSRTTLLIRIFLAIFTVEAIVMLAIERLPGGFHFLGESTHFAVHLLDSLMLTLIAGPVIAFWAVRPYVLARNDAENRLTEKNRRFVEAQRIGKVGSWDYDPVSKTFDLSDEACRILGVDPSPAGLSIAAYIEAIHEGDRGIVKKAQAASLANPSSYNIVYRVSAPDGQIKWVRERGHVIGGTADVPLKSSGTLHDITEPQMAAKAEAEFVAAVTHELRTPLTSIQGALGLLRGAVGGQLADKAKALVVPSRMIT